MRRYTIEIGGTDYVVDVHENSVDTFAVKVGGESYVVTLAAEEEMHEGVAAPEEAGGAAVGPGAPAVQIARKTPATPATAAMLIKGAAAKGGGSALPAPMPGVIIEVGVGVGDTVARGQLVAILDAMKMHNNIRSPRAGVIAEVCVTPGQAVGHGDAIVRFRED
ncbi:MAG: biotin/lipoyl-containing protein [Burkholderiales bacterium]